MKNELENFINDHKDAFYSRTPDAAVLQRIREKMMEADRKKKEKAPVISLRLRWAVAACLILLAGTVSYLAIQRTEPQQTAAVTPQQTTPAPEQKQNTETPVTAKTETIRQTPENIIEDKIEARTVSASVNTNEIDKEMYLQKTSLFAKLNNQSPSERLNAASQVKDIGNTDHDIVDALANTMNSDPNTNVRLAALDALSKFYREPYVKKKLLSSLQKQKDPMVQIALIELLTKMKEISILKQLNKIATDENTIQPVKDQGYSGILTLRS